MKRKRRVKSHEVYKYKARLNLDGSQMHPGEDYYMTYAPVASLESVRILLSLVLRHKWKTKQLDYVQAFPQAPVERECYMRVPTGIIIQAPGQWVLRVKRNICWQKQAGRVWNQYLVSKLTSPKVGFVQSQHDECAFYYGKAISVLYTDDSILAGPDEGAECPHSSYQKRRARHHRGGRSGRLPGHQYRASERSFLSPLPTPAH
jgi:hypothetical protein